MLLSLVLFPPCHVLRRFFPYFPNSVSPALHNVSVPYWTISGFIGKVRNGTVGLFSLQGSSSSSSIIIIIIGYLLTSYIQCCKVIIRHNILYPASEVFEVRYCTGAIVLMSVAFHYCLFEVLYIAYSFNVIFCIKKATVRKKLYWADLQSDHFTAVENNIFYSGRNVSFSGWNIYRF